MLPWPRTLVASCNSATLQVLIICVHFHVSCRFQAWVGGFSNLMDEFRTFMAGREAPFRLNGLRAIFVTPEDEVEGEEKVCSFPTLSSCHSTAC